MPNQSKFRYECQCCNKTFTREWDAKNHKKKQKKVKCENCNLQFATDYNRKRHQKKCKSQDPSNAAKNDEG